MLNNDFSKDAEKALPCIFSVEGLALSEREASLFGQANPFGFILFKRNCEDPVQVTALISHLKDLVGRDCPVLIDQEGGRVARLKPPHWDEYKPMYYYGGIYQKQGEEEACKFLYKDMKALADELVDLGINVNCAPVLDLFFKDADGIIGDRSFGREPGIVAEMGEVVCKAFLDSGITPVIKHIPGHGRSLVDSHEALPHVKDVSMLQLIANDFAPFAALSEGGIGARLWAMSAHMTYDAFDDDIPVSLSPKAIKEIIRRQIGFEGILICDDLDMKALDVYGSLSQKANMALEAGCDLALYCSGKFDDMESLSENLPQQMPKVTLERLKKSSSCVDSVAV